MEKDPRLREVIEELKKDEEGVIDFSLHLGVLKYKGRMVISKSLALLPNILHTYHDSVFGRHSDT